MHVVRTRPDILVLGAGGLLEEAWMTGVLAGIEDATGFDLRRCEYFVGTSAGALLAARLVAGTALERPADPIDQRTPDVPLATTTAAPRTEAPEEVAGGPGVRSVGGPGGHSVEGPGGHPVGGPGGHPVEGPDGRSAVHVARRTGAWAAALASPLTPTALGLIAPGGALARALVLRALPEATNTPVRVHRAVDRIKASFDGRLRIVAVERRSGRRVVFGQPRAPVATVGEAVRASCATPWAYQPVRIGRRDYVDGAVWSATNLDVAPAHRDTQVLCLNALAGLPGAHPALILAREAARLRMLVETQALRGHGAAVRLVIPEDHSVGALARGARRRDARARALAAGYRQGLALAP